MRARELLCGAQWLIVQKEHINDLWNIQQLHMQYYFPTKYAIICCCNARHASKCQLTCMIQLDVVMRNAHDCVWPSALINGYMSYSCFARHDSLKKSRFKAPLNLICVHWLTVHSESFYYTVKVDDTCQNLLVKIIFLSLASLLYCTLPKI